MQSMMSGRRRRLYVDGTIVEEESSLATSGAEEEYKEVEWGTEGWEGSLREEDSSHHQSGPSNSPYSVAPSEARFISSLFATSPGESTEVRGAAAGLLPSSGDSYTFGDDSSLDSRPFSVDSSGSALPTTRSPYGRPEEDQPSAAAGRSRRFSDRSSDSSSVSTARRGRAEYAPPRMPRSEDPPLPSPFANFSLRPPQAGEVPLAGDGQTPPTHPGGVRPAPRQPWRRDGNADAARRSRLTRPSEMEVDVSQTPYDSDRDLPSGFAERREELEEKFRMEQRLHPLHAPLPLGHPDRDDSGGANRFLLTDEMRRLQEEDATMTRRSRRTLLACKAVGVIMAIATFLYTGVVMGRLCAGSGLDFGIESNIAVRIPNNLNAAFADTSNVYDRERNIPFFWLLSMTGGNAIEGVFGSCLNLIQASEVGCFSELADGTSQCEQDVSSSLPKFPLHCFVLLVILPCHFLLYERVN